MDKETLSSYGWIVVLVLVLSVLLAMATPFGNFIRTAIQNTTQGLFDVSQKAGVIAGLNLPDQSFEDTSSDETPVALGCDTLYWDGNTEGYLGLEAGDSYVCLISEQVPTLEDMKNGVIASSAYTDGDRHGEVIEEYIYEDVLEIYNDYGTGAFGDGNWIIIPTDGYDFAGIIFPKAGVWSVWNDYSCTDGGYFTINGYTGFPHSEHCGH